MCVCVFKSDLFSPPLSRVRVCVFKSDLFSLPSLLCVCVCVCLDQTYSLPPLSPLVCVCVCKTDNHNNK